MSYGPVSNMADGGQEATPQQSQQSSEEPLGMRAVLIGATGAIGECLLGELLCSKVCLIGSMFFRCKLMKYLLTITFVVIFTAHTVKIACFVALKN